MTTPKYAIIAVILIGIIGIMALSISMQEPVISLDSQSDKTIPQEKEPYYLIKETKTINISDMSDPIYPIQLQKVLDSCKNLDNEINVRPDMVWSNGTHFIDNDTCTWKENKISKANLTDAELVDIKLSKIVVQNLVSNLIEKYDKEGIENLHQADFVMKLSGNENAKRYLYVINPITDIIIAHPRELINQQRNTIIQNTDAYYNLINDPVNVNGFWMQETFKITNSDVSFDQLLWIVPHDELIFTSGYVIDKRGNSFN